MPTEEPRKGYQYVLPGDKRSEFPTVNKNNMKAIANLNEGQIDYLQAGIVSSTDWSFTAAINSGTGELSSEGEVAESLAWLPDPVLGTGKALMRTVTPKGAISPRALTTGSLPASGKYSAVAYELSAGAGWDGAATVTTHAGAAQSSLSNAEENLPAPATGKIQVLMAYVLNTSGTYSIVGHQDVRPRAFAAVQQEPIATPSFLSWGNLSSASGASASLLASSGDLSAEWSEYGEVWTVRFAKAKATNQYAVLATHRGETTASPKITLPGMSSFLITPALAGVKSWYGVSFIVLAGS